MKKHRYIIGIDEVGRGPLAGPVTVGAVLMPQFVGWRHFRGLKDSKALSREKREEWFATIRERKYVKYAVSSVGERTIDRYGITYATRLATARSLRKLNVSSRDCLILLDGGLRAPLKFLRQRTIVRGDESECAIALASVIAKVTRDKRMVRYARRYPKYNFHQHKGYGTREHLRLIKECGLCDLHRRSFLRRLAPSLK